MLNLWPHEDTRGTQFDLLSADHSLHNLSCAEDRSRWRRSRFGDRPPNATRPRRDQDGRSPLPRFQGRNPQNDPASPTRARNNLRVTPGRLGIGQDSEYTSPNGSTYPAYAPADNGPHRLPVIATGIIPKAPQTDSRGNSQRARFLTPLAREIRAMPSAVRLREDYLAEELRALARRSKNVNQSRRLLSLAAVRDGMDRGAAAKIGGMDRQTLRDWVHRFNALGPGGLFDNWTEGPKPRLSEAQLAQFAKVVEAGPDREIDGVVRWRRIDLKRVIGEKFGVDFDILSFSPHLDSPGSRIELCEGRQNVCAPCAESGRTAAKEVAS
jgi:transposase